MSVSLVTLPIEIQKLILDGLKEKNEQQLNILFRRQGRIYKNLGLVCKKLHNLTNGLLNDLALKHQTNLAKINKYPKAIYTHLIDAICLEEDEKFIDFFRVAKINELDRFDRTALHVAAGMNHKQGRLRFVEILLTHPDIDKNIPLKGKTAKDLTQNPKIQALL